MALVKYCTKHDSINTKHQFQSSRSGNSLSPPIFISSFTLCISNLYIITAGLWLTKVKSSSSPSTSTIAQWSSTAPPSLTCHVQCLLPSNCTQAQNDPLDRIFLVNEAFARLYVVYRTLTLHVTTRNFFRCFRQGFPRSQITLYPQSYVQ